MKIIQNSIVFEVTDNHGEDIEAKEKHTHSCAGYTMRSIQTT